MIGKQSVILFGSQSTQSVIGLKVLRALGISVPLVITGDEDSGIDDWRLSLAKAAREVGYSDGKDLLVMRDPHRPEVLQQIEHLNVDLLLSLQWRRLLRRELQGLARCGIVNLHNAPLPLLRGCDPFSWAIHDGLKYMGVTLHKVVDDGIDSGPILAQRLWPISQTDAAWTLYLASLNETELLLRDAIQPIIAEAGDGQPQEARYSTYHPLGQFRFKELEINWMFPATTLSAEIRSRIFPPFQLPFFQWRGKRVEILECEAASTRGEPGKVVGVDPLEIAAKRGSIKFTRVRLDCDEISGAQLADSFGIRANDSLIKA